MHFSELLKNRPLQRVLCMFAPVAVFLVFASPSATSQTWPQGSLYGSGEGIPNVYAGNEVIDSEDIAITGMRLLPGSNDVQYELTFLCLTDIAAPESGTKTIGFNWYERKTQGQSVTYNLESSGTITIDPNDDSLPRGTFVTVEVVYNKSGNSTTFTQTITGYNSDFPDGFTYTASPSFPQSDPWTSKTDLFLVSIEGTFVDWFADGVVTNSFPGEVTDVNCGGVQPSLTNFANTPNLHFNLPNDNLNGTYGLGFPGVLEARLGVLSGNSWDHGTWQAIGADDLENAGQTWDATTRNAEWANLQVVCPASELLYNGTGYDNVTDAVVDNINQQGWLNEVEFDAGDLEGVVFNVSPSKTFNKSVTIKGMNLPASSIKRFAGPSAKAESINWTNGKLALDGSGEQQQVIGFSDLDSIGVSNSSGAVFASNDGTGKIRMNPGGRFTTEGPVTIAANETLVLQSGPSGTASIGTQVAPITGAIAVQRYIGPIGMNEGMLGSSWVQLGNLVPGTTAEDITSQIPGSSAVYRYNNSSRTWSALASSDVLASPWNVRGTSEAANAEHYQGYFIAVPATESGYTLEFSTDPSFVLPAEGTITINLETQTLGWNLLVNPFAAPISVDQMFADNPSLQLFSIYSGVGRTYNFVDRNARPENSLPDDFATIDVGQSFWVRSQNAAGDVILQTLTIRPEAKAPENASFIREQSPTFQGAICLAATETENGQTAKTHVSFETNGEIGIDGTDREYLSSWSSSKFEIWSTDASGNDEDMKFLIQSTGDLAHAADIPLVIESKSGGPTEFALIESAFANEELCVQLQDLVNNELWQLSADEPVTIDLEPNTLHANRFVLKFTSAPELSVTSGYCEQGTIAFDTPTADYASIQLLDANSGELVEESFENFEDISPGVYSLITDLGNGCVNEKSIVVEAKCMGEINNNNLRDVQDLMSILTYIGEDNAYEEIDNKGADCDCDGSMTNMDILTFLSAFGITCD